MWTWYNLLDQVCIWLMKSVRFSQGTQISLANKPLWRKFWLKILAENTKWCILETFDFPKNQELLMHSFYYFSMINFKIQHIVQYQPLSLWSYKFLHYLVQIDSKIPMDLNHTKSWRLVIAHRWAYIHF